MWELGLERARLQGDEITCLCPFHADTRPSLGISLSKASYYCFGCGKTGSLVELLYSIGHTPPSQAASLAGALRDFYGYEEENLCKEENLLDRQELPQHTGSHFYLHSRGIGDEAIKKYDLRFSLERCAVIFPVRDIKAQLLGWVERRLLGQPKYRNSPGLPRNGLLFGEEFAKKDCCYVVESVMDCVYFSQFAPSVVSTLGARVSPEQEARLRRFERLKVIPHHDRAGRAFLRNLGAEILEYPEEYKDVNEVPFPELGKYF